MTMVGPQRLAMDSPYRSSPQQPQQQQQQTPVAMKLALDHDLSISGGYYVHKKPLGEGGFGKVKLATHLKTNMKVAIKMMNKEKLGDDLARVYIEIEALKQLKHDNIAKMLQVIETKTEINLVLEYCSGGELFDYLVAKRRLSEPEVRIIMRDLFNVLLYIHDKGFAHRDLKPENILLDEKRKIKLIDFGLAANFSGNKFNYLETCCGSPAYAAPELLHGMKYSGPAVDVWSSGVLFYSLLTGRLPFEDENLQNLYRKIQAGKYEKPLFLSIDVLDLLGQMLKTNPMQRISVAKALQHRWFKKDTTVASNQTPMKPPMAKADEFNQEAFKCCTMLFPMYTEEKLKSMLNEFGYVTSTYILLKNNPNAIKDVQSSFIEKVRLFTQTPGKNDLNPEKRQLAIKRKLNLEGAAQSNNENNSPVIPSKRYNLTTPRPVPQLSNQGHTPYRNVNTLATPVRAGVPKPAVGRSPNPIVAKRIVSPKMMKNCENADNNVQTPKKMVGNQANTIKSPLREINNLVVLSPPQQQQQKAKPQHNVATTPKPATPVMKPPSTSKMSILKRFLGSATPSRANQPRKLTGNNSNQITMTPYQDPNECMKQLIINLQSKGVECKQNNFVLKCYLNDKIHSSLKFELEICEVNGLCVIHRKRLKGDSWNYKKICEIILQLSNEKQVELLNKAKLSTPSKPRKSLSFSNLHQF